MIAPTSSSLFPWHLSLLFYSLKMIWMAVTLFVRNIDADGHVVIEFAAKMKALEAVDLYQQARANFMLLLSSVLPSSMVEINMQIDSMIIIYLWNNKTYYRFL